jgi:hypothetical protein
MLDQQTKKEIKLLIDCAKIIDSYRYPDSIQRRSLITTPDSVAREKKEFNLYKRIIKRVVELRGYVKFEVEFYLHPSFDKLMRRRIKATSYENVCERMSMIYKKKDAIQKIKVVS